MNRWVDKDPSDVVAYAIDWSGALSPTDVITEAMWNSEPSDLVVNDLPISGHSTGCTISQGTAGTTYVVTCTITTDSSNILERNIMLKVRQQ